MKRKEDWSHITFNGRLIFGPPLNPVHVAWCLAIWLAVLLFSTCYFISLNRTAQADLAALCAEAKKLPGFKGVDGSGGCLKSNALRRLP